MRMTREDYERGGRTNGYGMYERGREMGPEMARERWRDNSREGWREEGMRRGRGGDTVRHANIVKVIEVLAESEHGWEDAAHNALTEAQRSIRNIKSIWVKDMQCVVREGRIRVWRLTAKISFAIESDHDDMSYREA